MVAARREGKWVHYSINFPKTEAARKIFEHVLIALADDQEMRRDRATLTNACCSTRAPKLLRRAPKPRFAGTD